MVRLFLGLVVVFVGIESSTISFGATFIPLDGTFYGISEDGSVVVGKNNEETPGQEAICWTQADGISGLGFLPGGHPLMWSRAEGASADGSVIVGAGNPTTGIEAFRWTQESGMVGLGYISDDWSTSEAYGVSADGSVVVGGNESSTAREAFRWTQTGGMVGLGSLLGSEELRSLARDVSADGSVVVGISDSPNGTWEAFHWTQASGMVGLSYLSGGNESQAYGISADGSVVVGSSESSATGTSCEAFRWTSDGGMIGLGNLPGGTFSSVALGVSGNGSVVVGNSNTANGWRAFFWTSSEMVDLQDFLSSNEGLDLPGWNLNTAIDVSNNGRIIMGEGTPPLGGDSVGWVVRLDTIHLRWTSGTDGSWDDLANWIIGCQPGELNQDDVFITPDLGLTVTGSASETIIDSLTIGTATSGIAQLILQADLTTTNGTTINDRGQLTLSGQILDAGTGLVIFGAGILSGYGEVVVVSGSGTISATGDNLILGDATSFQGFSHFNGTLEVVDGATATLQSRVFAKLGTFTTLAGGTLIATNGVTLPTGSTLGGYGQVNAKISATFGSTIYATGNLTLGDTNSYSGFYSEGNLYTDTHEVTIHDRNEIILGSLTELGDGTTGGMLTAGTADPTDTHSHFVVEQGKNVVGRGTINGHFENHGHVIGDGTEADERIVFSTDWSVSGTGTFENTLVLGTFSPDDSPLVSEGTNQAFGGTVEILLGSDSHSQINDTATISLMENSTLAILPWSNYEPDRGDMFAILAWQDSLEGTFSEVIIDPWFAENDIEFFWYYDNIVGSGSLVLVRGRAGDPDFNDDGSIDNDDFQLWEQGFGTQQDSMFGDADDDGDTDGNDFLIWQAQYRGATGSSSSTMASVPEPTSIVLMLTLCGLALTRYRMRPR